MPGGTRVPRPRHPGTSPCPEFPGPDAYPGPLPPPPPSVFDDGGKSFFLMIFFSIHGKYFVIIFELEKKSMITLINESLITINFHFLLRHWSVVPDASLGVK